MTTQRVLDYYTRITPMTHHERAAGAFDGLPLDLPGLARVIQGQLLHEHWARAYGEALSDERRMQSHVRSVDDMLAAARIGVRSLLALSSSALTFVAHLTQPMVLKSPAITTSRSAT